MYRKTDRYDTLPLPLLPLRIVDVAPLHDVLPAARRPSRAARVVAATKSNIVRLIPGVTTLPLGASSQS